MTDSPTQSTLADGLAGTGRGASVYIVDSGIRPSHQEFRSADGSRSRALYGGQRAGPPAPLGAGGEGGGGGRRRCLAD